MGKSIEERINELCRILLEIGALLMSSGANTARIRTTIMRIANAYGFNAELLITHRALMLTLYDEDKDHFFSRLKRTSPHGANFKMVSGISRMSWRIVEEKWNLAQVQEEINRLKSVPHYNRLVILSLVALADASFCRLFGGGHIEMIVAFVATFAGLFVRQEVVKKGFNPYLCIFFASLTSSLISGLSVYLHWGANPEYAFATSVLYLIPGIPLINSMSDLLDGNIMNGIVRGVNGLIIAFSISLGLLGAILLYNI
ncbi:MAG TPA: threonine/serine exporter family protein [Sunxiuqinia sp.]|nr:threonine/serine exporter family protein [Sunxiuqinia sp.]